MNLKIIGLGFGCFVAGAVASHFVTRHFVYKQAEKAIDAEVLKIQEELSTYYEKKKAEREQQRVTTGAGKALTEEPKRTVKNPLDREVVNPYEQAKKQYNLVNPAKQLEEPEGEPDDEDDEEDDEDDEVRDAAGYTEQEMMDLNKIDRTVPYVINNHEFCEEFDHHEKTELYYYRYDDVLCDESTDEVFDSDKIEETVGYDALKVLDTQTTCYVRNEPLGVDYEIVAINGFYAQTKNMKQRPLSPREQYAKRQKEKGNEDE